MNMKHVAIAIVAALAIPVAHAAQDIDRSLKTGASPSVEISNIQGKVTVTGWERQEVKVTGVIEHDKDELEFTADDKRVVIKVRPEKDRQMGRREARLEIKVPFASLLNAQTVSADIVVDGIRGTQRLESVSGDITTTVFDEALDLRTISGDAQVRGQGGKAGARLASVSGDLTARGLKGEVEARTVSGEMDVEVDGATRLGMKSVSGDVVARAGVAGAGRVEVETISGRVELSLQKPVDAEFDVGSHSGSIDNCFGPAPRRKSEHGPGLELRFTEGGGAARVRITTLSGNIGLCSR